MIAPASQYDQDVSVLKLSNEPSGIQVRNQDQTFRTVFPATATLIRIMGGLPEAFVKARFVGCVLVFGKRIESWDEVFEMEDY